MSQYTDSASSNPSLNFDLYAEELSQIAIKATTSNEGAFTVGVFGSWGSGKTTLMRLIQKKLIEKDFLKKHGLNQCKTIWFNPWKFDEKEALWNALIQTILLKIKDDPDINNKQIQENIKKLAISIGLHAYDISKEIFLGLIKKQVKIYTDVNFDSITSSSSEFFFSNSELIELLNQHYKTVNKFEEDFKDIVEEYVGKEGKLIVFIDDLDRCLPENALTILESLKLYLDQANCIFFIGLDKRVIEQAVNQRYRNDNITGKEYIEKMIQLNFFLPEKDSDMVKSAVQDSFKGLIAIEDEIWNMVMRATKGNIRKTKQFIIAWDIIQKIALKLQVEKNMFPKLAKILLIQMNYPELYDALPKDNYYFMETLKTIIQAHRNRQDKSLGNHLAANPDCEKFYNDIDLRNFLIGDSNEPFKPDISEPEELRNLLKKLSQIGVG